MRLPTKQNNTHALNTHAQPDNTHYKTKHTFCLARLFTKLAFGTILTAYSLLVSKLVTLYTFAKPPLPNNFPLKYLCTVYPSPEGRLRCSTIVIGSDEFELDVGLEVEDDLVDGMLVRFCLVDTPNGCCLDLVDFMARPAP